MYRWRSERSTKPQIIVLFAALQRGKKEKNGENYNNRLLKAFYDNEIVIDRQLAWIVSQEWCTSRTIVAPPILLHADCLLYIEYLRYELFPI